MSESSHTLVSDLLDAMVRSGSISDQQRRMFEENHQFFENQRATIIQQQPHMWVASINHHLISSRSWKVLDQEVRRMDGGDYAYVEQIP